MANAELEQARAQKKVRDQYLGVIADLEKARTEAKKRAAELAAQADAREYRSQWQNWRRSIDSISWFRKITPRDLANGAMPAGLTREQFAKIDALPAFEAAAGQAQSAVTGLEREKKRLELEHPELTA